MAGNGGYSEGVERLRRLASEAEAEQERYIREVVKRWRFDTISVHGLYSVEEALRFNQGSVIEPVYMSTSQGYRDSDHLEAGLSYIAPNWCYSRIGNPSMFYLEAVLALLEGYGLDTHTDCCAFSSGMGALRAAIEPFLTVRPGAGGRMNFVSSCHLYGGTFQQFSERQMKDRGVECRWVKNPNDLDEWAQNIDSGTRFVFGEMPSNPTQAFFDLEAVAGIAHERNVPVIIDSTVATPALMRPLGHGADIVVHSVTKSMAASGFTIGGAIISKRGIVTGVEIPEMKSNFARWVKFNPGRDNGNCISPMSAVLTLNDLRMLRSRMDLLSQSAQRVAEFLASHPRVESVSYLGLPSNPQHELAKRYMVLADSDRGGAKPVNRFGHLLSFCVAGSAKDTRDLFDSLKLVFRATDLGRIKSLATIPAISTHLQQGEGAREMARIPANMIRLCVGAEHPDDIIADLDQALARIGKPKIKKDHPTFAVGGGATL